MREHISFAYYEPLNNKQREFHQSKARHKLLIGGYRAGKTYPALHESFMMCMENPNHEFLMARNTWDSLTENLENDALRIAEQSNVLKDFDKIKHNLTLQNNTMIRFRPLSQSRKEWKGMNLCGFLVDDPDIEKYKETIAFLFSRLTNPPGVKANYFQTLICANWEGRNWLWRTYMKDRKEGGDDRFAYWILQTVDNPTIGEEYIKDQQAVHSKKWMDRFIYGRQDSYAGLIYDEYTSNVHNSDLSWCDKSSEIIKILAIDTGITDPTVVLKMATDMQNIYVYDEWYKSNIRINVLGEYLRDVLRHDTYRTVVIDPTSSKREQTSGTSVKDELHKEYDIRTENGINDIRFGIEIIKSLLTVRGSETHMFIDNERCPFLVQELEMWRWEEPEMTEFDELSYKEKPQDKNNHALDALRYGVLNLKKYMRGMWNKDMVLDARTNKNWEERYMKLPYYRKKQYRNFEAEELRRIHYGH